MANIKHNKIKNIGVLFELLTRQITSDTINGIEKSPAIIIVKEFFNKNSYLTKELNLYKALQKQKYKNNSNANRFIDLVITEHKKLSSSKLNREKYNLIKEIKTNYKLDEFVKSHIPNYKLNASIYTLLESNNIKKVQNPSAIMKSLLKEYINNINNNSSLKKYLISEITIVNKAIGLLKNKVSNNVVKIKLNEVSQQLNLIKKENKIRDKHLVSVLRSYNLIKELRNVTK